MSPRSSTAAMYGRRAVQRNREHRRQRSYQCEQRNLAKIFQFVQPHAMRMRLRPLFLRAFSIAFPAVVLIRALNPDVLAFFILLPLKVLFVICIVID